MAWHPSACRRAEFQSTRSHGARRESLKVGEYTSYVSIHALAWSATFAWSLPSGQSRCFNPRARMERDIARARSNAPAMAVSIHALAWSATSGCGMRHRMRPCFNPRARMERDAGVGRNLVELPAFQSTRSHGARLRLPALPPSLLRLFQSTRSHGARRMAPTPQRAVPGRFNPRARMERDHSLRARRAGCRWFQSTRSHGARLAHQKIGLAAVAVSIHALAWSATDIRAMDTNTTESFNPRARMERDTWPKVLAQASKCFNPRARMERDDWIPVLSFDYPDVSIHALAWSATLRKPPRRTMGWSFNPRARMERDKPRWRVRLARDGVSIHALAWSATWATASCKSKRDCFNPRARMERDSARAPSAIRPIPVSIHALAWSATGQTSPLSPFPLGFNPRARMERDTMSKAGRNAQIQFQSTRSHGARRDYWSASAGK